MSELAKVRFYTGGAQFFANRYRSFFSLITDMSDNTEMGLPMLTPGTPEEVAVGIVGFMESRHHDKTLDVVTVTRVMEAMGKIGLARFEEIGITDDMQAAGEQSRMEAMK